MSFMEAIRGLFARVIQNVGKAVGFLTESTVVINADGSVEVQDPFIQKAADKASALTIAFLGVVILTYPAESRALTEIGDQLLRTATRLWSGGS